LKDRRKTARDLSQVNGQHTKQEFYSLDNDAFSKQNMTMMMMVMMMWATTVNTTS
jgi:hypothetical protein